MAGMGEDQLRTVLAPKVTGAWLLHTMTADDPLEHFVLFSSAASVLGLPGAANYAAANAFLDGLARHRVQQGRAATSIAWGPWSGLGFATTAGAERLSMRGVTSLPRELGLDILEHLAASGPSLATVLRLDVRQWRQLYPKVATAPFLTLLAERCEDPKQAQERDKVVRHLEMLESEEERMEHLEHLILDLTAGVLRRPVDRVDTGAAFRSLGVDSLMGIELRNALETQLGIELPGTVVWIHPTIPKLARHVLEQMHLEPRGEAADERDAASGGSRSDLERELEELSDEQVAIRLAEQLAALQQRRSP
jgi:acyl carrier protein